MQRDPNEQDLGDEEESVHGKESSEDSIEGSIWVLHPERETKGKLSAASEKEERIETCRRTCNEVEAT